MSSKIISNPMQEQQDMKYTCLTIDTIRLMADAANIVEPSVEVATAISEDVTFKLRQIISKATRFMQHSKRTRLTCADINKALKWSDCQPVFGYECRSAQRMSYSYLTEAQVFRYEDEEIDLVERYNKQPLESTCLLTKEMQQEAVPNLSIGNYNSIRPVKIENDLDRDIF